MEADLAAVESDHAESAGQKLAAGPCGEESMPVLGIPLDQLTVRLDSRPHLVIAELEADSGVDSNAQPPYAEAPQRKVGGGDDGGTVQHRARSKEEAKAAPLGATHCESVRRLQ